MNEPDIICECIECVRLDLRDLMGKRRKEYPWLNCPTKREWAIAKLWDPDMSDIEWAYVLKLLRPILDEPERQRKRILRAVGGAAADPSETLRRKM